MVVAQWSMSLKRFAEILNVNDYDLFLLLKRINFIHKRNEP